MSLRLRNKKWKDSTHMWTRIYQHHSKASLESFVIIFFFVFHYIIIGENYLCIYEEARRMLFWLLNRRFLAHSLMCVILAEEDQKLVSILFILEWVREREKPHHTFHDCCEHFFLYFIDASTMTKRPQRRWKQLFWLYIFFSSAMIIVLWTELSQGYRISWWSSCSSWRLLIFLLALHHACDHPRNMSKNFLYHYKSY